MSNNRNPYMNQNMSAGQRGMNMRSGCGCPGGMQVQRSRQGDCGCSNNAGMPVQNGGGNTGYTRVADIPAGDRNVLLKYIDEVSFGACEAMLYLDTHPDCQEALQYFRDHNEKRNAALGEYAKLYGPLTPAQADESCDGYWQWISQPWPWEGGNC